MELKTRLHRDSSYNVRDSDEWPTLEIADHLATRRKIEAKVIESDTYYFLSMDIKSQDPAKHMWSFKLKGTNVPATEIHKEAEPRLVISTASVFMMAEEPGDELFLRGDNDWIQFRVDAQHMACNGCHQCQELFLNVHFHSFDEGCVEEFIPLFVNKRKYP
jgi:hypothetical protein